jgi:DNA polymerase elongation subunit (family B)
MSARKGVKAKLRREEEKPDGDPSMVKVYDQIQYAYKINANSLYGIMSFAQYNTYSP